MGATVMIAQYIGAGDKQSVARTVDTIYSALLAAIVPLSLLGVVLTTPLLTLIRVPVEAFDQARVYCIVVFLGGIGSLGYNVNAGILQGLGDSKTPLLFLAVASVINIVLDLLFVLVFRWAVFGVALATIIGQACSWIFGIFYINRKYNFLHIRLFQIRVDRKLLGQIIRLGVPSAIQQCQFSVAILIMQALINGFGNDFAAGFAAANKIDSFAFMPIQSFSTATTTYVGQNMGAGRLDRVQRGARRAMLLSTVVCIAITALVIPFRRELLMLFNRESAVVAAGEAYLLRVLTPMFVLAVMFILSSVLRGAGATMVPMVASVIALWGARVPAAYLLAYFFGPEELLLVVSDRLGPGAVHLPGGLSSGPLEGKVRGSGGERGMKLLLAAIGETDWNARGQIQGQSDPGLNETGRAQARALAAGWKRPAYPSGGSIPARRNVLPRRRPS